MPLPNVQMIAFFVNEADLEECPEFTRTCAFSKEGSCWLDRGSFAIFAPPVVPNLCADILRIKVDAHLRPVRKD
jgi:hypothetical protein